MGSNEPKLPSFEHIYFNKTMRNSPSKAEKKSEKEKVWELVKCTILLLLAIYFSGIISLIFVVLKDGMCLDRSESCYDLTNIDVECVTNVSIEPGLVYIIGDSSDSEVVHLLDQEVLISSSSSEDRPTIFVRNGDFPFFCGSDEEGGIADKCYNHHLRNYNYVDFIKPRNDFASLALDHSVLWITGGKDKNGFDLKSTEYVSSNGSQFGPELPVALSGHCMVHISESVIMVVGQGRVFYFSTVDQSWRDGPLLTEARQGHVCGKINVQGQSMVIVAGGLNMTSTEILIKDQWKTGPILNFVPSSIVSFNTFVLMVSGTDLHQLSCPDGACRAQKLKETLQIARKNILMFKENKKESHDFNLVYSSNSNVMGTLKEVSPQKCAEHCACREGCHSFRFGLDQICKLYSSTPVENSLQPMYVQE